MPARMTLRGRSRSRRPLAHQAAPLFAWTDRVALAAERQRLIRRLQAIAGRRTGEILRTEGRLRAITDRLLQLEVEDLC
jgi:hypothetical protein